MAGSLKEVCSNIIVLYGEVCASSS